MAASDPVQHKYKEISCEPRWFTFCDSVNALWPAEPPNKDRIVELKEQLYEEVINLAKTHCTEKQWVYLRLYFLLNKTQEEIADELGVCQSTVHKSLHGNIDYQYQKRYGGSLHKIRKICDRDRTINDLLNQLVVAQTQAEENWHL